MDMTARFHIGDVVLNGTHIGTVTDVGTVLVAVTTATGAPRMVCPWELVKLRTSPVEPGAGAGPQ
ncbi:mechanosensitive ion channel domain-containing protein [Mycolicibacterium phocaicum]|uniref:mechanosensitive ion channel domain-containing protein n=2 Tax=Mycolicibacterium phocaicum TaxID=319706 RepID=UPI0010FDD9C6